MRRNHKMPKKVVLIGLDGATLTLIKPWVQEGKLPHLAKLMAEGSSGNLTSVIHPISQHAWTTFLTGKNAGKHGIYDFYERKPGTYDFRYTAGNVCASQTIFQILSQRGKKVGGLNIPVSYPVEAVNGFMIAGMGAPGKHSDFVYPPELKEELFARVGDYKLLDEDRSLNDVDSYIKYHHDTVAQTLDLAKFLLDKYEMDFFMLVFLSTDQMQHLFWHCKDREHPLYSEEENKKYGGVLLDIYVKIDQAIGELRSYLGDDYSLIIMSDHGAGPTQKIIYLHKWLEEKGLLFFKNKYGLGSPVKKFVAEMRHQAMQFLPRSWKNEIKRFVPSLLDRLDSFATFSNVDWSRTKAFPWGIYGNIIINLKGREPQGVVEPGEEYEELCNHISRELLDLKDPETREAVVERVYRRSELFHGDEVDKAPDLIVVFKDYAYYAFPSRRMDPGKEIFELSLGKDELPKALKPYSHHRLHGIGFFQGEGVKKQGDSTGANIIDLPPTILYMMEEPIPDDMDGRVLTSIFTEDYLSSHPITFSNATDKKAVATENAYAEDDEKAIEAKLKSLGYLE